jgi:hypothetical protein
MKERNPISPAADRYAEGLLRGSSGCRSYGWDRWDATYWRGFQEGLAMARNDRQSAERAMADLCALVRAAENADRSEMLKTVND